MLINSKDLLLMAEKKGYAVASYNIYDLSWVRLILEACNRDRSPVVLSFDNDMVNKVGNFKLIYLFVKSAISQLDIEVPVVLHFDNPSNFEQAKNAIDAGFTSIFVDASKLDNDDNFDVTNKICKYAHAHDATVDAKSGSISNNDLTYLEKTLMFTKSTDIDFLLLDNDEDGVFLDDGKNINFDLLGAISKEVKLPLILDDTSKLDTNEIKTVIFCGVSKIRIKNEIITQLSKRLKSYFLCNTSDGDVIKLSKDIGESIKNIVHQKNRLFDSKNRAN